MLQFADDPWFIALVITLIFTAIVTGWALRGYLRDWLVLAMALPPALFRKVFGPPRH